MYTYCGKQFTCLNKHQTSSFSSTPETLSSLTSQTTWLPGRAVQNTCIFPGISWTVECQLDQMTSVVGVTQVLVVIFSITYIFYFVKYHFKYF